MKYFLGDVILSCVSFGCTKMCLYFVPVYDTCSDQMLFFLCSLFVPICISNHAAPIPPCRDVCVAARTGCESVVENKYNQTWPVDCTIFPEYDTNVCISPQAFRPPQRARGNQQEATNALETTGMTARLFLMILPVHCCYLKIFSVFDSI